MQMTNNSKKGFVFFKFISMIMVLLFVMTTTAIAQTNKYYNSNNNNNASSNKYYNQNKNSNSNSNSNKYYNQNNNKKNPYSKPSNENQKNLVNKKDNQVKDSIKTEKKEQLKKKEKVKKEAPKKEKVKKESTKKTSVNPLSSDFKRNYWVLFGYNYNFTPSDKMKNHYGPIYGTFGLDILKYLSFDLSIGGIFGESETKNRKTFIAQGDFYTHSGYENYESSLTSIDFKPYIVGQYIFDFGVAKLRPFVGVGPSYHLVYTENKYSNGTETLYTHDIGVAAKAGLRVQLVEYLMIGVTFEYLWHESGILYNDKEKIDMSGIYLGAEIGVSF